MANYRVTCITSAGDNCTHEEITHIGNNPDGWKITAAEAIERINQKHDAFYIHDDSTGKTLYLVVVNETGKPPHLRVQADGQYRDDLLVLVQCYI